MNNLTTTNNKEQRVLTDGQILDDYAILTPRTFAELCGDDGGNQRGVFTETTALALFKSEGFPKFQKGRCYFVTWGNAKKWLDNSGGKIIEK